MIYRYICQCTDCKYEILLIVDNNVWIWILYLETYTCSVVVLYYVYKKNVNSDTRVNKTKKGGEVESFPLLKLFLSLVP